MVIEIKENSIELAELKRTLSEEFGDTYKISNRGKAVIVIAKNKTIGATVTMLKNKILVVGTFPKLWMSIVYMISLIALGIVIPLAIYFVVYHKKMKTVEKEVATFIKEAYAHNIQVIPI